MRCPECQEDTHVTDSRRRDTDGERTPAAMAANRFKYVVRRRRECKNQHRFTTYELPAEELIQEQTMFVELSLRPQLIDGTVSVTARARNRPEMDKEWRAMRSELASTKEAAARARRGMKRRGKR